MHLSAGPMSCCTAAAGCWSERRFEPRLAHGLCEGANPFDFCRRMWNRPENRMLALGAHPFPLPPTFSPSLHLAINLPFGAHVKHIQVKNKLIPRALENELLELLSHNPRLVVEQKKTRRPALWGYKLALDTAVKISLNGCLRRIFVYLFHCKYKVGNWYGYRFHCTPMP